MTRQPVRRETGPPAQPSAEGSATEEVERLETLLREARAENVRLAGLLSRQAPSPQPDAEAVHEAEQARQRTEAELSFALELNDALRLSDDPVEVQATAARLLAERLQADRVFYSEIVVDDGVETCVIERDYCRPGAASLTGRLPFRQFSDTDYDDYRAGRTVSSPNVFTDDRRPSQREAYRAAGVAAFVGVPLHERGRLVSVLCVLQSEPRTWTPEEVRLAEQTADRTWHAVQRARAERALRVSEQRFRLVLAHSTITVATVDRDLRYTWVFNPAGNLTVEEVMGRPFGFSAEPEHRAAVVAFVREVLASGVAAQMEATAGTAGARFFEVHAEPLRDAQGEIVGAALVSIDITDREQAEEALRQANERLRVSDRRKDEFIAILSHELRNPLAPIRYALPLLAEERLGEEGRRAVAVIDRHVTHLSRLVDDLLDLSRITSGKIDLRLEHVTLAAVLTAAVEAASPSIAAARHSLNVDLPDAPVWLRADLARLSQAVTNVLNNSAKYTPAGGRIGLEATTSEAQAVIRVVDNGVGIAADGLASVFEMFHQGEGVNKAHGGLGIGLGLTKRVVEMHGGCIEVYSAGENEGAEFTIRLPLADAVPESPAPRASVSPDAPVRLRVLVADDNVDLVDMLALVVETEGHDVRKAFDGRSAMSAAIEYRPQLILLDVGLPDISGLEVVAQLRRHAEVSGARIVALTGWGQAEDRRRTAAAGFDDHLTKPADPLQIQQILREVAQQARPLS